MQAKDYLSATTPMSKKIWNALVLPLHEEL
jgi:hypothetical protein